MSYSQEQYISALVKENKELKEQLNEAKSNRGNSISVKVEVDTTEVDEAINKLKELDNMLQKIDEFTERVKRDVLDIKLDGTWEFDGSKIFSGRLTGSGDNPRPARD